MPETGGFLKTTPKGAWIAAGAVGIAALGYIWWKKHQTPAPASATASAYGYGGYGYGVSPIYGYGFNPGSAFPGTGSYGYGGNPTPTTNAQWFQQAVAYLAQNGTDTLTAEAALAKYLAGQQVTSDQALLIQIAEGALGPPPQAGPNGYPPNINVSGPGSGGTATNPVTGLRQTTTGSTGSDIAWNASSGATSYQVTTDVGNASMIGATSARIHNIGPSHDQANVTVLAQPAASGAQSASITVKVHHGGDQRHR